MKNHSFCLRDAIFDKLFQNVVLELFSKSSTMCVLSPSNDKYLGASILVLFHVKFKSDEFGFLKPK